MSVSIFDPVALILLIPIAAAALLAVLPGYRLPSQISVAFSILIAFIVIGIFLFRIRERFDTVDVQALDRHRGERQ